MKTTNVLKNLGEWGLVLAAITLVAWSCTNGGEEPKATAPEDQAEVGTVESVLGAIPIPPGNPQTPEKVELGKMLFFDPRLSGNNQMACATCHSPDNGFSDGVPRNSGPKGELGRNSPTIWNAAYADFLFWDGRVASLEEQAAKPIPADVEMAQPIPELIEELKAIPQYPELFGKAFGSEEITFTRIIRAIAAFERTIVTANSPFDRFQAGDQTALSMEAQEGMRLFNDKAACVSCHAAPHFTDYSFHVLGVPEVGPKLADVAASQQRAEGLIPRGRRVPADLGRFEVTGDPQELGAFKTPTLRNTELTGPYMHDGVFPTLEEVVAFYNRGGGDADNKSPLIQPLNLSPEEEKALVAFLKSLTDTSVRVEPPELPPGPGGAPAPPPGGAAMLGPQGAKGKTDASAVAAGQHAGGPLAKLRVSGLGRTHLLLSR